MSSAHCCLEALSWLHRPVPTPWLDTNQKCTGFSLFLHNPYANQNSSEFLPYLHGGSNWELPCLLLWLISNKRSALCLGSYSKQSSLGKLLWELCWLFPYLLQVINWWVAFCYHSYSCILPTSKEQLDTFTNYTGVVLHFAFLTCPYWVKQKNTLYLRDATFNELWFPLLTETIYKYHRGAHTKNKDHRIGRWCNAREQPGRRKVTILQKFFTTGQSVTEWTSLEFQERKQNTKAFLT